MQHFKHLDRKNLFEGSVTYSYCPKCDKKPLGQYETVATNTYKCPNCGFIGGRDDFIHKEIFY